MSSIEAKSGSTCVKHTIVHRKRIIELRDEENGYFKAGLYHQRSFDKTA